MINSSHIVLLQIFNPFETVFSFFFRLAIIQPPFGVTNWTHFVSTGCIFLQIIIPTVHVIKQSINAFCIWISCPQWEFYPTTFIFHSIPSHLQHCSQSFCETDLSGCFRLHLYSFQDSISIF